MKKHGNTNEKEVRTDEMNVVPIMGKTIDIGTTFISSVLSVRVDASIHQSNTLKLVLRGISLHGTLCANVNRLLAL